MKCQIPQISWHGRDPVLSVDLQALKEGDVRRLATGGTDAHVVIWYVTLDTSTTTIAIECACDLPRHNKSVNVVRFSPNGEFLASGDDEGVLFVWKLREASAYPKLEGEEDEGNKEDWFPFKMLRGHLDDICDLNWSPNGDFIVSGSIDNTVVLWDVQKGVSVHVAKEAKGFVQGVTWDPLNQYFASISSDRMVRVYSVASQRVVQRICKAPWVASREKGGKQSRSNLFHDDTLQSFCRRLTFSPDGNLLFVPSGIKEKDEKLFHTTYVFSRFELGRPVFHFPTSQKYTLAVKCCPLLFKLRESSVTPFVKLPYRMVIAVVTQDSVFLYDTQQLAPFAFVSNIHYTHLTDLSWSSDGHIIIVSSTDGYCSFVTFNEGELGEIYVPEVKVCETLDSTPSDAVGVEKSCNKNGQASPLQKDVKENPKPNSSPAPAERSPRKSKSPKKLFPMSTKKPAVKKMSRDITSFFSPPSKRLKICDSNNESECYVVFEKKTTYVPDDSSSNTGSLDSSIKVEVTTAVAPSEVMESTPSNENSEVLVDCKSLDTEGGSGVVEMDCDKASTSDTMDVKSNSGDLEVRATHATNEPLKATSVQLQEKDLCMSEVTDDDLKQKSTKVLQEESGKSDKEIPVANNSVPSNAEKPKRRVQLITIK